MPADLKPRLAQGRQQAAECDTEPSREGPMNITCFYDQTPFTLSKDEKVTALRKMHAEGLHHYDVRCPRCGRANAISRERLEMFTPGWEEAIRPPKISGRSPAGPSAPGPALRGRGTASKRAKPDVQAGKVKADRVNTAPDPRGDAPKTNDLPLEQDAEDRPVKPSDLGPIQNLPAPVRHAVEDALADERRGQARSAGDGFRGAAEQANALIPSDSSLVATLYEHAAYNYGISGSPSARAECADKAARMRGHPLVNIDIRADQDFTEGWWTRIQLTVRNRGYGIARDVRWRVRTERYDVDEGTGQWSLEYLAHQAQQVVDLGIRPKRGEVGDDVPFLLEWSWKGADGQEHHDQLSTWVRVRSENDARPMGQALNIFHGDVFAGDKVGEDKIESGGEKARDKVEIHRGGRMAVDADADTAGNVHLAHRASTVCPRCSTPNPGNPAFCGHCGFELSKSKLGEPRAPARGDAGDNRPP